MESLSPSRRRALALGALVLIVAFLGLRHLTRSGGAADAVPGIGPAHMAQLKGLVAP